MKQVEERYISLLESEIAKFTPQEIREYEASKIDSQCHQDSFSRNANHL